MKLHFKTESVIDSERTGLAVSTERSVRGFTQAALADGMEISAAYLCELEAGRKVWTKELFGKAQSAMAKLARRPR